MHEPLWLTLEGAFNARDVGGLPAAGGRSTRRGVLVRSDALGELTRRDVCTLVDGYGLRHVVDLRAPSERHQVARGHLGAAPVTFSELDVLTDAMLTERRNAAATAPPGELSSAVQVADSYYDLLQRGAGAFVAALERLAARGGSPALVHCAAGKDRTGILIALLLDAAGVRRDAIVADYAATAERMDRVWPRLAATPAYAEMARTAPAMMLSADPATMVHFLERLWADAGGAAAWFVAAGASPQALACWQARILD